jgi:hypothetical protein
MPARFEGVGAFTLGCSLWDPRTVRPYDEENEHTGLVFLSIANSSDGATGPPGLDLFAVIDGPTGTWQISGKQCGVSVDWSGIPTEGPPPPD